MIRGRHKWVVHPEHRDISGAPGDIVVADSDGVIVIPPSRVEAALAGADAIVALEAEKDAEVVELRAAREAQR